MTKALLSVAGVALAATVAMAWYHPLDHGGAELAGIARAIDGDTLVIDGKRIRLWGIDAPERHQTCQGARGDVYECGQDAATVLTELTRDRRVACAEKGHDRYGRIVAVCWTSLELNAAMVRRGWAIEYVHYSGGKYRAEEAAAKREGLGIWSGRFEPPAEWRKSHK